MPQLTSRQAFDLAQQFHHLAVVVGNYRFDHWEELTSEERRLLEDLQFDILNDSTRFNGLSISLSVDNLRAVLDDISQVTKNMEETIKKLKDIGKVISIATAAVTLGAAIVSMNPDAIRTAISGAVKILND